MQGYRKDQLRHLSALLAQGDGQALPEQPGQVQAGAEFGPAHQRGQRVFVPKCGVADAEGGKAALTLAAQGAGWLSARQGKGAAAAAMKILREVGVAFGA
jgi:hypothetical protein